MAIIFVGASAKLSDYQLANTFACENCSVMEHTLLDRAGLWFCLKHYHQSNSDTD